MRTLKVYENIVFGSDYLEVRICDLTNGETEIQYYGHSKGWKNRIVNRSFKVKNFEVARTVVYKYVEKLDDMVKDWDYVEYLDMVTPSGNHEDYVTVREEKRKVKDSEIEDFLAGIPVTVEELDEFLDCYKD